jgi:hypothetical protein
MPFPGATRERARHLTQTVKKGIKQMNSTTDHETCQETGNFAKNLKLVSAEKIVWEFSGTTALDCYRCDNRAEYLVVFSRDGRHFEMPCCKDCVNKAA